MHFVYTTLSIYECGVTNCCISILHIFGVVPSLSPFDHPVFLSPNLCSYVPELLPPSPLILLQLLCVCLCVFMHVWN